MKKPIKLDAFYKASSNLVVRKIKDLIIIIPIVSDADTEDYPFILNSSGKAIWQRLNGKRSLKNIVADLATEFKKPVKVIEKDVTTFVQKLLKMKMIVEIPNT